MKFIAIYWVAFGLLFAATMIAHDVFVFADVRQCINDSIQSLSESERHPTQAVRKAFRLDSDALYSNVAFSMYRDEYYRRQWNESVSFHSHKTPATLTWTMALWFSFDRERIESYRLRSIGADDVSIELFGKPLNALDVSQLKDVWRATGRRPMRPVCPW